MRQKEDREGGRQTTRRQKGRKEDELGKKGRKEILRQKGRKEGRCIREERKEGNTVAGKEVKEGRKY